MLIDNNLEMIKNKIKQLNGLVVIGFYDSKDSFCAILRNNVLEAIKTIKPAIELLEFDVKKFNYLFEEFSIINIPTYKVYYNGRLMHSFESLATKYEIEKVFEELVIN